MWCRWHCLFIDECVCVCAHCLYADRNFIFAFHLVFHFIFFDGQAMRLCVFVNNGLSMQQWPINRRKVFDIRNELVEWFVVIKIGRRFLDSLSTNPFIALKVIFPNDRLTAIDLFRIDGTEVCKRLSIPQMSYGQQCVNSQTSIHGSAPFSTGHLPRSVSQWQNIHKKSFIVRSLSRSQFFPLFSSTSNFNEYY